MSLWQRVFTLPKYKLNTICAKENIFILNSQFLTSLLKNGPIQFFLIKAWKWHIFCQPEAKCVCFYLLFFCFTFPPFLLQTSFFSSLPTSTVVNHKKCIRLIHGRIQKKKTMHKIKKRCIREIAVLVQRQLTVMHRMPSHSIV